MIVRLDDAARDDIREATEWYADRDLKAAKRFSCQRACEFNPWETLAE